MDGQDDIPLEFVATGRQRDVVYAIRANGEMPARSFFNDLPPADKAALLAYFDHLCQSGRLAKDKLKKLHSRSGEAWEFIRHDWRIGAFPNGRQWVLTSGFAKKKQKTDRRHIELIERIRDEHLARVKRSEK
ncbi:MAG TPA: type II toxin-antitoxin system RelE/ParE family toxin [Phycisphaerae bacterium]|jgi:hypothetical protein